MSDFTVTLNDGPTITVGGWGHTHLNKLDVLDNLTEDHLIFLNSGTIDLDDYYNKTVDTASNISLNTDNFNNNLDLSIDDTQKLADAVDNMAAEGLPVGGTENDLLQGDGTWQPKNKSLVGLDQVDNTSDALKVVSGPQQAEINTKKDNFSENSAFNKDFGTIADTVAQGSHLHSGVYDVFGSAITAVSDHKNSLDPHPQYYDSGSEVKAAYESLTNTNAYTDAEKSKLSSLESSKFLGTYISLSALESAHSSPVEGSYGHVDTGVLNEVAVYIWDSNDNKYHLQMGASSAETMASVKAKYESNPDTNAFTDSEKNNLSNQSGINTGNQTGSEIKAAYELESNTNAFTDTDKTNLLSQSGVNTGDQDVSGYIEAHRTDDTHAVVQPSEYSICALDSERIIGSPNDPLDLAKMMDYHWSAGMFNGGTLSVLTANDPPDGKVNLSSGAGLLRETDSDTARLILISTAPESDIVLVDNSVNYIYADYNAGVPIHVATIDVNDFNCKNKCVMYRLSREGNDVKAINLLSNSVDANRKGRRKDFELDGIRLVPGTAQVADEGLRGISVSAGRAWLVKSSIDSPSFNTSAGDTFELYYGSGVTWASTLTNAQIDNIFYNDGTLTPATLGVGRTRTDFLYLLFDEIAGATLVVITGGDYKNPEEAAGAAPPAILPAEIGAVGIYVAKIIIEQGASEINSIYGYVYESGHSILLTAHNTLPGLQGGDQAENEFFHLNETDYNYLTDTDSQLANLKKTGEPVFSGGVETPTIRGSILTGENLTFHSNTSKDGNINLGDNFIYDEANTKVSVLVDDLHTGVLAEFRENAGGLGGTTIGTDVGSGYIDIKSGGGASRFFFSTNSGDAYINPAVAGLAVGTTATDGATKTLIHGGGNTSATKALVVENSDGVDIATFRDDGLVEMPTASGLYLGENVVDGETSSVRIYGDGLSATKKYLELFVDNFGRGTLGGDVASWLVNKDLTFGLDNYLIFPGNGYARFGWNTGQTNPSMFFDLGAATVASSNLIFANGRNTDYQHPINQSIPTLYLHSDDTTTGSPEYLKLQHNGTDAEVSSGFGKLELSGADGSIIKGSGNTSATYAAKIQNSDGDNIATFRDDGLTSVKTIEAIVATPTSPTILFGDGVNPSAGFYKTGTATYYDHGEGSGGLIFRGSTGQFFRFAIGTKRFLIGEGSPTAALTVGKATTYDYYDVTETVAGDVFKINNAKDVGINEVSPTAKLDVEGTGNDDTTYAGKYRNSDGDLIVGLRNDGAIIQGASIFKKPTPVLTSPYDILPTDNYISVKLTIAGASTLNLPALSTVWDATTGTGIVLTIKDASANSGIYNITIVENVADTNSITDTETGQTNTTINSNGGAIAIRATAADSWEVIR